MIAVIWYSLRSIKYKLKYIRNYISNKCMIKLIY